jgi:hypothetical protein
MRQWPLRPDSALVAHGVLAGSSSNTPTIDPVARTPIVSQAGAPTVLVVTW